MTAMRKGHRFVCKLCGWTVTACCCKTKKQHQGTCCECKRNKDVISKLRRLGVTMAGIKQFLADGATRNTLKSLADGIVYLRRKQPKSAKAHVRLDTWGLHA